MDVSPTIQHRHGRIRSITGTNPAANTEISETVPDRRRWILRAIRFSLASDANGANRYPVLLIDDGSDIVFASETSTAQVANSTLFYNYADFGSWHSPASNQFCLPLPPIPLGPGFRIRTTTTNLQVGDDYSAPQMLIEEWIDP